MGKVLDDIVISPFLNDCTTVVPVIENTELEPRILNVGIFFRFHSLILYQVGEFQSSHSVKIVQLTGGSPIAPGRQDCEPILYTSSSSRRQTAIKHLTSKTTKGILKALLTRCPLQVPGTSAGVLLNKIAFKMVLVRIPALFLVFLATASAHFSSPAHVRVIGVSSRRKALAPRSRPFGPRYHLHASSTVAADNVAAEDEELGGDEVIPDDYESVVQVVPSKQHQKEIKPFKELGFGGKLVRGTRNIILVTTTNFGLGVTFGLTTAGVRGFPNLMTRKEGLLGTPWNEEIPMRLKRYSGKCYRWAKIWGPVFAVWGFTDTAVSLLRNGDNDEINFMMASSAAAVWHNRDKTVQRKVVVAVVYAALTYAYVKFNEYYVVGPEGWQDKYSQNEEVGTELQASAAAGDISRGGDALSISDQNDIY